MLSRVTNYKDFFLKKINLAIDFTMARIKKFKYDMIVIALSKLVIVMCVDWIGGNERTQKPWHWLRFKSSDLLHYAARRLGFTLLRLGYPAYSCEYVNYLPYLLIPTAWLTVQLRYYKYLINLSWYIKNGFIQKSMRDLTKLTRPFF